MFETCLKLPTSKVRKTKITKNIRFHKKLQDSAGFRLHPKAWMAWPHSSSSIRDDLGQGGNAQPHGYGSHRHAYPVRQT
jgi:hypothetical protein